jgi:hypothetical protein
MQAVVRTPETRPLRCATGFALRRIAGGNDRRSEGHAGFNR